MEFLALFDGDIRTVVFFLPGLEGGVCGADTSVTF